MSRTAKSAGLSLSAKVQRARQLIDETFRDLQESVERIEEGLRRFLGGEIVSDDPSGLADVVPHRRGRPPKVTPPHVKPSGKKGVPYGKRTPEQRARIAAAVRASWARRRAAKGKAQKSGVVSPAAAPGRVSRAGDFFPAGPHAPAARKFEPRRTPDPRRTPWKPANADRALDSIPLKQTAAEAQAEENEKRRADERKNRVRVNADDVL